MYEVILYSLLGIVIIFIVNEIVELYNHIALRKELKKLKDNIDKLEATLKQ